MSKAEKERSSAVVKADSVAVQKALAVIARRALSDLEMLTSSSYLMRLVRHLSKSESVETRSTAYHTLQEMGPDCKGWTETLERSLGDSEQAIRVGCALLLSEHTLLPEAVIPVLVEGANACVDERNWPNLDGTLGLISHYDAIPPKLLSEVVRMVSIALENTVPLREFLVGMNDADLWGRTLGHGALLKLLRLCGEEAKSVLDRFPGLIDESDWMWDECVETAEAIDPSFRLPLRRLVSAAASRWASTRAAAVHRIGRLGEHAVSAVPQVAALARDEDWRVRMNVAIALGQIGERTPPAVDSLNALSGDIKDIVKLAASFGMAKLGIRPTQHLDTVLSYVSLVGDKRIRSLAAWAAGELGYLATSYVLAHLVDALSAEKYDEPREQIRRAIERLRKMDK